MVGLVSNTHLASIEKKINKMSDSSGKEDATEGKTETLLSNGEESELLKDEDTRETKMDVDGEEEETPKSEEPTKSTDEKVKNSEPETSKVDKKTERRKSRSSRSHSSNSSSSIATPSRNAEPLEPDDDKENNDDNEEDFFGFESSDTQIEVSKEKLQKLGDRIAQLDANPHLGPYYTPLVNRFNKESSVNRELSELEDGVDSADNDLGSGLVTPTSSARKARGFKKSINIDLSNPEFKKPFEYGWVRELVYRSTNDSSLRRNADIYYYTPSGKKVRSSREIIEHLTGDLTIDNFSFFKEPIGLDDPTKEIIREAKAKPGPRTSEDGGPPIKSLTPKVKVTPVTPKISPKESSKNTSSAGSTPKVQLKANKDVKNRSSVASKKFDKKRKSAGPDDVDVIMDSSPEWNNEQKTDPARDVCSIECRLAMGIIPDLQCIHCLCLYHPECFGYQRDKMKPALAANYVCKNCHQEKEKLKSLAEAAAPPLPPPQLTPIASVARGKTPSAPTPQQTQASNSTSSSSTRPLGIVGAVTTWLAPSSSIQVTPAEPVTASSPADNPQSVYIIQGKKYIYMPKNNVVNVTQQPVIGDDAVSNPPGLFLVPCDPSQQSQQLVNGPSCSHPSTTLTNGLKRSNDSPVSETSPPEKRSKSDSREDRLNSLLKPHPAQHFMMNLNAGFIALLHAFQYLKVFELLRAGCVSKMWMFVASHQSLWETVRMKNSRVSDWKGFANALSRHRTKYLDLRKMLVPETPEEQAKMWEELCEAVKTIPTLKKVDLGRCSPAAFTAMAEAAPQLESLVSLAIKGNEIDLKPIVLCRNLTELKIKAVSGGLEIKELSCLKDLTNLKTLALTTIKNLKGIEDYLPEGLISLELGECSNLSMDVATVALPKLKHLKRLRLEKGQGECPTLALLEAIATLPHLTQLELINFDVKPGFDKSLAKCTNLKTLLIIPTYVTQSATTNHVVMGGVAKLSGTLTYFIWGLTLELLKVTDLFIGQVETQKGGKAGANPPKKGSGDSIPILKPSVDGEAKEGVGNQPPSQVDILALPNLQRVLSTLLPTTKIKILKVPFSATWRQTVSDGP